MYSRIVWNALIIAVFAMRNSLALANDPCADFDSRERHVSLVLVLAVLKNEVFYGTFELFVPDGSQTLALDGTKSGVRFELEYPSVSVEFRDLNSEWVPFAESLGDYTKGESTLRIEPGKKAQFTTVLMPRSTADLSASEFRIQVRANNFSRCVTSQPFRPKRAEKHIKGFESAPAPAK